MGHKRRFEQEAHIPPNKKIKREKKTTRISFENEKDDTTKERESTEVISEDWTIEQKLNLLKYIIDKTKNTRDMFKKNLKDLEIDEDWIHENVSNHSMEKCKEQLMEILRHIKTEKTLHQLAEEAMLFLNDSAALKRTIPNAYNIFSKENMTKFNKLVAKGQYGSWMEAGRSIWNNMTSDEKAVYQSKHEKKLKANGLTHSSSRFRNGPTPPLKPTKIHLLKLMESSQYKGKTSFEVKNEISTLYSQYSDAKKLKYIKKAVADKKRYEAELAEHIEKNPDLSPYVDKKPFLTLMEEKLYLKIISFPFPIAKNVIQFYSNSVELHTHQEFKEYPLHYPRLRFKKLPSDEQEEWTIRHREERDKYPSILEKWLEGKDETDKQIARNYLEKKVSKPRVTTKELIEELHYVDSSFAFKMTKFDNEPEKPTVSLHKLFASYILRVYGEMDKGDLKKAVKNLDIEIKEQLKSEHKNMIKNYTNRLMRYVSSMTEDSKKVYLGFRRVFHINKLGKDIFKDLYPSSEYPVFRIQNCKLEKPIRSLTVDTILDKLSSIKEEDPDEIELELQKRKVKGDTSDSDEGDDEEEDNTKHSSGPVKLSGFKLSSVKSSHMNKTSTPVLSSLNKKNKNILNGNTSIKNLSPVVDSNDKQSIYEESDSSDFDELVKTKKGKNLNASVKPGQGKELGSNSFNSLRKGQKNSETIPKSPVSNGGSPKRVNKNLKPPKTFFNISIENGRNSSSSSETDLDSSSPLSPQKGKLSLIAKKLREESSSKSKSDSEGPDNIITPTTATINRTKRKLNQPNSARNFDSDRCVSSSDEKDYLQNTILQLSKSSRKSQQSSESESSESE